MIVLPFTIDGHVAVVGPRPGTINGSLVIGRDVSPNDTNWWLDVRGNWAQRLAFTTQDPVNLVRWACQRADDPNWWRHYDPQQHQRGSQERAMEPRF